MPKKPTNQTKQFLSLYIYIYIYIYYQSKIFGQPHKSLFFIRKVLFLIKQVKRNDFRYYIKNISKIE